MGSYGHQMDRGWPNGIRFKVPLTHKSTASSFLFPPYYMRSGFPSFDYERYPPGCYFFLDQDAANNETGVWFNWFDSGPSHHSAAPFCQQKLHGNHATLYHDDKERTVLLVLT